MPLTVFRLLLPLVLVALLAGCAATKLKDSWKNPKYSGPAFKKILVLGVSSEAVTRRSFEDTFAGALQDSGVSAIPSYTLISRNGRIEEDKLRTAVAETGADGVLITRVVNIDQKSQTSPGYVTLVPGGGYYGGFYGYYGAAWGHYTPPATYTYKVLTLETNLWEVKSEDLAWSGFTEITDPSTVRRETESFSKVVIDALKSQGLI